MADIFAEGFKETPYWWDLAPHDETDEQVPPSQADVVVIGSGNVGLSCALSLSRLGRKTVVLDSEEVGYGASTRNAGYLGRGLAFKYSDLVSKLGREDATKLATVAVAAHDYTAALIRDEQITCAYRDTGRFLAAPSKRSYDKLAKDLDLMLAHGVPIDAEMIPRERQHEEIASVVYHGGQLLRGNGIMPPGLYHKGLVEQVRAQGADVIGFCPVTAVDRQGAGFVVTTPKGKITAGDVFVATNGHTPKAFPWQRRRVVPASAFMIATEALSPEMMTAVMPGGRPLLENRNTPLWIRPNEDGTRILFGGTTGEENALNLKAQSLYSEMTRVAPMLDGVKLTHCWTGKVAMSFDWLPHTGTHEGIHYAMGWCATGVPMGTYLGHQTALRIVGDPASVTALDDRPFPTRPFYTGNPWFLPLAIAWLKWQDRRMMRE
ncbi:MAG: FAD-binding oxidoreductase [Rhodospirillaceae bacterium]|nr:FAD-binding oxidoreductase [Rhodospirillaceae bacterium]